MCGIERVRMAKGNYKAIWTVVEFIAKYWQWATSISLGAGMTVLAAFTEVIRQYAPFSYGLIFIVSTLVAGTACSIFALAAERLSKRSFWEHVKEPTRSVNPLERTFEGMRVALIDVAEPDIRQIRGKTFVDCELIGRRLPYLFSGCIFKSPISLNGCDLIAIPYVQGEPFPAISNTILVIDCVFRNCKFYYQTMLVTEHDARDMDAASGNKLVWLVPPRSIPDSNSESTDGKK
jgi:hypothetical protein